MFILRAVFWLSLLVLVLPTDARQQQALTSKIMSSVTHISTFCDRNAKACETGARYWGVFRQKADYGFQLAAKLISEQITGERAPSPSAYQSPSNNTLRRNDLAPQWRGTKAQNRI